MTLIDFAHKLNAASTRGHITALLSDFINDHSDSQNESDIKKFVAGLREDQITTFGSNLGYCRRYCLDASKKEENESEADYLEQLAKTSALLEKLSRVYQAEIEAKKAAASEHSTEIALDTLRHQKEVILELDGKVKGYKSEIDESKKEMQRISASFNDKIFSVLINTVSLLGIFVTIAYAGFGVASIFSSVNLAVALRSEEAFVKNIFYILLTALLSYNLLLLLVYFIFKISRPIGDFRPLPVLTHKKLSFSQSINLAAFLWIDGILAVITVLTLAICIWVW